MTSFCYRICRIVRLGGPGADWCFHTQYLKYLCDEIISHPAELSNAGVGGLSQPLSLYCRLAEEEKYLVIIRVFTFWDPKGTNKLWFW